jgi:hypothetical protein
MVHSEELFAHATASVQGRLTSERVILDPLVEALKLERYHHVNETDCSPSSRRKNSARYDETCAHAASIVNTTDRRC